MIARLFAAANDSRAGILARTVLFVEDEALVRDFVARELEDAGFIVFEAGTAEEGLEILQREPVGSLFTDIRLPGAMDGWGLAEAARQIHPRIPILYATGFTAEAPRLVPGSVFLRKPYLPSAVIAALGRLTEDAQD